MKIKISFVAFLIPLVILLFGFRLVIFDTDFYKSEFEKYGVYENLGKEIADPAVENLISYMKSGGELSDFFNEKEKVHMVYVKNIIQKLLILFFVLLLAVIASFFFSRKYFFKSLFYGGILTLLIILSFFIVSYTSFDFIFTTFHELSFSNDLWKLNPEVDYLKALLPDSFFYDALLRIFLISSITSVVLSSVGFLGMKKFSQNRQKVQ